MPHILLIYIDNILLNQFFNYIYFYIWKKKRIQFKGFWSGFNEKNNFFVKLLKKYNFKFVIVNTEPDIIIFSRFKHYYKKKYMKMKMKI